jgi:hypothetical protein
MINLKEMFSPDFGDTLLRFALCYLVNWIIVNFLYFKKAKRRDFFFTFMIISVAIFFLVYLMMGMDRGKATMGVGLGLFGIFSIMRYRTDAMPVREMTYLFVVVCLSVVHAMADTLGVNAAGVMVGTPVVELLVIDVIVILSIVIFERSLKVQASKLVQYDRIDLIKPEKRDELKADLEQRLGLDIVRIEVGGVDFLKDSAVLRVTYKGKARNEVDTMYEVKKSQWRNAFLF